MIVRIQPPLHFPAWLLMHKRQDQPDPKAHPLVHNDVVLE
jgi:hypothetical protein